MTVGSTITELKEFLAEQGIGSMVYYPVPQDQLPVYRGQYDVCPASDLAAQEVLSLPIWPELREELMEKVVAVFKEGLAVSSTEQSFNFI
jgi:dTDP-4-amino-4,6-dideoxygalactose transaminase